MIKAILSYYKLFLFVFLPLLLLPLALVLEGEEDGIDFKKLGQFRLDKKFTSEKFKLLMIHH